MASEWRINARPQFLRQDANGQLIVTTPASFNLGDFVEATAAVDVLFKDKPGKEPNEVLVHLVMREVVRLYSSQQLCVSHIDRVKDK